MNALWAAALALLLTIACGGGPQSTPGSPKSPAAESAATEASSSPSGTPSPPALSTVDFSCKLPVYSYDSTGVGAFIAFPERTVTLASEGGYYYDRAVSRWVPEPRRAVSPDGRRYAYTDRWPIDSTTPQKVHVVDAATRKELQSAAMPDTAPYQVIDFTSTGVYLHPQYEGIGPGVWRFDLAKGTVTKISEGFYPPTGATWLTVVDPSDPHPEIGALAGDKSPNRIDRRDDAGGIQTWFYAPAYAVSWVAFAGPPAILVAALRQDATGQFEEVYWLVDGPNHATRLPFKTGHLAELAAGFANAIADEHGIWIGGAYSLYLVRPDGAILRVFDRSAYPANGCF